MVDTRKLFKASLSAGREFLRAPSISSVSRILDKGTAEHLSPVLVPIRSIGPNQRERVAVHLLSLTAQDRYLRFGYAANDEQIRRYVDSLDFGRDEIFGIFNRRLDIIAMAHLAFTDEPGPDDFAEFGVSVLTAARGRGYGSRLFERAAMHARNQGVDRLLIHALSENAAMLQIARKAGATVERDGAESEALLRLAEPTLDTRMAEIVEQQFAEMDYKLKVQSKQFWDFVTNFQEVRRGMRAARRKSGA
jgi:RimJ/RimL family protein N-acetyltransferase